MEQVEQLLREFHAYADHPARAAGRYREETGRGAVGCFPAYTPEPIVHAAGLLPLGLWGGHIELDKVRAWLPSFACSLMQANMELQLQGAYDGLEAVLIPTLCDTLKCVGQKWKGKCPAIQFVHPQNRRTEEAVTYLAAEYQSVRARLEEVLGVTISDEALTQSLAVYNEHSAAMRDFSQAACDYPMQIRPSDRHAVMKSAFFMRKEKHTGMVRALLEELRALPPQEHDLKKVVLTGIMAEPQEFFYILQEHGFAVAADDLAQESRQYRADYPEGVAPMERMARQWQGMECSLAYDETKRRITSLSQLVRNTGSVGVIVCMMKFCDPEEFDYPILRHELEDSGIPHLYLEIDQQMTSYEQLRTRIQTFADMTR